MRAFSQTNVCILVTYLQLDKSAANVQHTVSQA